MHRSECHAWVRLASIRPVADPDSSGLLERLLLYSLELDQSSSASSSRDRRSTGEKGLVK